jgi:hypothetical protein
MRSGRIRHKSSTIGALDDRNGLIRGSDPFLDTTVTAGFLKQKNRELLRVAANAEEAVAASLIA